MEYQTMVEQLFHQSINAKIDCVEMTTAPLVRAGLSLAECFLADGKALVYGHGNAAPNAQFLVASLMNQGERERPGLPAILLDSNALHGAIESDYGTHEALARQVLALGQPGDRLVLFSCSGSPASLLNAISAAHERDMTVIAFTAQDSGDLPVLLAERDIDICVPLASRFRIHENHLLLSFALCELVEYQMFGGL
ncbi:MAG: SIS domain-containing protein [Pseudomonadales bacterium]|nr:SIS domain-containing protein [Pseudomonadales bacterium]